MNTKKFAALFLFVLMSFLTLVFAVSCSTTTPNSAFIGPVKTISANNPSWTPTPTFTFTMTPTPTPAFPVSGFNGPYALGIDSNGYEYVGDTSNNIIRQYNAGVPNSSWPNGKVKSNGLSYTSPKAIAVDSGNNLYVVGNGAAVTKYSNNGDLVTSFGTNLSGPLGVACSGTTLYVSDSSNQQIVTFPLAGGTPVTIESGLGYTPRGIATNNAGTTVLVADGSNMVHIYAYTGTWGAGTPVSIAGFSGAYALVLDPSNNLFVSDTGNHQIEKFTAGNYSNVPAKVYGLGTLNAPEGLALDASGNIYVVDSTNNTFYEFAP